MFSLLKKSTIDISVWFGFLLTFLISVPMIFKSGYIAFTDFIHGPQVQYNWQLAQVALNFLRYIFDYISPEFSSRVFIPITILLIYFSARYFVRFFTKDNIIVTAVSSLAVLNLFVYDRILYGQIGVVWAYAFLFIFTAAILRILHLDTFRSSFKYIVIGGVALGFAIDSSSHSIFIFSLVAGLVWMFYNFKKIHFQYFKFSTLALVIVFAIGLLMNSFWIYNALTHKTTLGGFVSEQITQKDLVAFQTSGNSFVGKLANTALLSGFWGKDQKRYVDLTSVPLWWVGYLPFIFLFIYGSIVLYRKDKNFLTIIVIGLILSLLLSVATSNQILIKLYDLIPYYVGLREPHKWAMVLAVLYSAVFVYALLDIKERQKNNVASYTFLALLIILHLRFFLSFWGQVQTFQFPESWARLDNYLATNSIKVDGDCKNKTLVLPWHLYVSYPFSQKITANLASTYFTCPVIIGTNMEWGGIYDNSVEGARDQYGRWLVGDNTLPPPQNIQFVVLFKTVDWQKYEWLSTNPNLTKIEENEDWILYRIVSI